MHNLHLVVVQAESPEDACNIAENGISDYGDENNWRTICGCVSEENEVYVQEDGRYPPDEDTNTIDKINAWVDGLLSQPNLYSTTAMQRLKEEPDISKWTDSQELWSLGQYVEYLKAGVHHRGEKFNVFEDSYREWDLDECGVTHLDMGTDTGQKKYVVFVDMHS